MITKKERKRGWIFEVNKRRFLPIISVLHDYLEFV